MLGVVSLARTEARMRRVGVCFLVALLALLSWCVLSRRRVTSSVERTQWKIGALDLDVSRLSGVYVSGKQKENLFRGLASSPKWKLTRQSGAILALRRQKQSWEPGIPAAPAPQQEFDLTWKSSLWGFEGPDGEPWKGEFPDNFQARTLLRFSAYDPHYWADPALYTTVPSQASTIKLDLWFPSSGNATESALRVELGEVLLEIYEESRSSCGLLTQARVSEVADDIREFSVRDSYLATYPIALNVSASSGGFRAWGAVNPGEKGHIYFEVVRYLGGKRIPVLLDRHKQETVEHVGWSDDKGKGFPFEVSAVIHGTGDDQEFQADHELWFKPEGNKQPRMLMKQTKLTREWRR